MVSLKIDDKAWGGGAMYHTGNGSIKGLMTGNLSANMSADASADTLGIIDL